MKELKILYLYPDILDLYGDVGNIEVLKYRIEKREIKLIIDTYSIGDAKPDFKAYDIIFAGGGADNEQRILSEDLVRYKDDITEAVKLGVFFLLICGSYQLFGKYYKGVDGKIIPGLGVFDYYTEAIPDRKKRCIGNIIVEANLGGKKVKVIGFENHGGLTYGVDNCFGKVLYGNGNKLNDCEEGFMRDNVIATYLHGPLLSKNPELTDYILMKCLKRKYSENIELKKLNDEFEKLCREQLFEKFLKISKNKW
ncbi:MAG: glutamine amidotransferase [Clostridia bacterium]|nr:glutamine amidotransferase [Clostridia bacterium]